MVENNSNLDTAVLGAGCFWCIEAVFLNIKGVDKVIPGYIGGTTKNPTYSQICEGNTGHAEAIKCIYNEEYIDLEKILEIFFLIHNPTELNRQGNDVGTQYRSAIFYTNENQYKMLSTFAKKLGSAFQKINFLRDLSSDFHELGRTYFPNVDLNKFSDITKNQIELDIQNDFDASFEGIKLLPKGIRSGVLLAYYYYVDLLNSIRLKSANDVLKSRIRISNWRKLQLLIYCQFINKLNWI